MHNGKATPFGSIHYTDKFPTKLNCFGRGCIGP